MNARLCICPSCGTVSVQEVEEPPMCGKCGSEDVDWTNQDVEQLKGDLRDCIVMLQGWERKEKDDGSDNRQGGSEEDVAGGVSGDR